MNDTHPPKASAPLQTGVLLPAIARLGLPLFVFSVMLLSATLGLRLLLTPDRFPVRIGDRVVRLADLEAEQEVLLLRKADLLNRHTGITESRAPVLNQLRQLSHQIPPIGRALLAIEDVRTSFAAGGIDPVSIAQITIDGSQAKIVLTGAVKNVGDRSTQMLALFVDGLRAIALPLSVSEPEYVQQQNPDGTTSSPFLITVSLPHAIAR